MKNSLLIAFFASLFAGQAIAQTSVNQPYNNGPETYTINSGANTAYFNYFDNGGPSGYYSNGSWELSVVTFMPGDPSSKIQVEFTAFGTEAGWDPLYVFDGATTSDPKIASGNGNPAGGSPWGTGGWWGGQAPFNYAPNIVRATNSNGALTFAFITDGSVIDIGWEATVTTFCDAFGLNNVGITSIDTFSNFCPGTYPVYAKVQNFGTNPVTNFSVNWEFDGAAQTPFAWSAGTLDTCMGASPSSATVLLGTKTWAAGSTHTVKAWTSLPNGVTDPIAANDTLLISLTPGLSGSYTIGGTSPDFVAFSDAVAALTANGVCDSVIFNVRNGTYNEQISIGQIPGVDSLNAVIFQSESGDSSLVTLTFSANSAANHTLRLNGADWLAFHQMTIEATNTSYGTAVEIANGANHNRFSNNLLKGIATTNTWNELSVVYSNGAALNQHNAFLDNRFLNGSFGLFFEGNYNSGNYSEGLTAQGNAFENQYYRGLYLYRQHNALVSGNTVQSNTTLSGFFGMYLYDMNGGGQITSNRVQGINAGGYGLWTNSMYGTASQHFLVANNYVQMGGSNLSYGMTFEYGEYIDVLNNTVRMDNVHPSSPALYNYSGGAKIWLNNILSNPGGGLAIQSSGGFSSDRNDLFTTGPVLVNFDGGNYATLADWQAFYGSDLQSVSANPDFVGIGNFHVTAIELNGAAAPSLSVLTDLDGEARNATTPDIGADEFTPPANDAELTAFVSPVVPFAAGLVPVKVLLRNNGSNSISNLVINWQVNGAAQPVFNWSGSLASAAADTVTLGNFTFNAGTAYDLLAVSSLPNGATDAYPANDTAEVNDIYAALAGIYTIGGASPDFADFTAAVAALHQRGVSAAVTFNVRNGTYDEQISINQVVGADSLNPVTFQSESGDSSLVTLTFGANSAANYTLRLNGTDWLTFHKLSIEATNFDYARAVVLTGNASHDTWSHCRLRSVVTTYNSTNQTIAHSESGAVNEHNVFLNNHLQNGSYGIYVEGNYNNGNYVPGVEVRGNFFENQFYTALQLYALRAPIVDGNTVFTNSSSDGLGIYLNYCHGGTVVTNNKVSGPNSAGTRIYFYDVQGDVFNPLLVANNFVYVGGSGYAWGIGSNYGNYQNFLFNTVQMDNAHLNSRAFYTYYGNNEVLQNNILANTGGGLAIEAHYSLTASDDNDLFTNGAILGNRNGTNQATLADWQTTTGFDANSLSVNPAFVNPENYVVTAVELNNAASPSPLVPDDIEGETRHATTPDIGADEFTPPSLDAALTGIPSPNTPFAPGAQNVQVVLKNNGLASLNSATLHWQINGAAQAPFPWAGTLASGASATVSLGSPTFNAGTVYHLKAWSSMPNGMADPTPSNDTTALNNLVAGLSGIYTIGGTTPDFLNFTTAVAALHAGGVVGAVTFHVRNGTYTEQISINQITGADAVKTVTFQSESGDSSLAILRHASTNYNDNFTLHLNGADRLNFRRLTIEALSTNYGQSVVIQNGANHNEFTNNLIKTADLDYNNLLIDSNQPNEHLTFRNNDFLMGYNGISAHGNYNGGQYTAGLLVEDNIFRNQLNAGVYASGQRHPVIRSNVAHDSQRGIQNYDSHFGGEISSNHIHNVAGYGIIAEYFNGESGAPALIANNFVHTAGTGTAYGIYIYVGDYLDIAHNSVNVTNTPSDSRAFYNAYGSNKRVLNNIFANPGGGFSYFNDSPASITQSDYNDLYTSGATLGHWGGTNYSFIADWKATTGQDPHSVSINPAFVSPTDLHTSIIGLNGAATPLASVPTDFDGDTRDPVLPDIGADEFSTSNEDAGVTSIDSPVMPFPASLQPVRLTIFNNGLDTLETVTVHWTVNGTPQTPLNWSGSLLSGESEDSLNVGSFVFEVSTLYSLQAWTSLPNAVPDTLNFNDTTTVNNLYAALSGVYTIGGTTPDFPTFQAAVSAMTNGGVVGAVTFNVRNGTYTEQINIPEINGASAANTVTFQSESGDSTTVTLQFGSAVGSNNVVLQLNGADWFRFKKMTFKNTGTSSPIVIGLSASANNNRFENNEIIGSDAASTGSNYALVFSDYWKDEHNTFLNNRLLDGSYGFFWYGNGASDTQIEAGNVFEGNRLEGQYFVAMDLHYQNAPQVIGNETSTSSAYYYTHAIYGEYWKGNYKVTHNYIHDISNGYGIYLNANNGTSLSRGLIANNFVNMGDGGIGSGIGIHMASSTFQDVFHNTVQFRSTDDANAYGFYANTCSNLMVKNNVFACTDKGRAFYKTGGSSVFSDYNDLFSANGVHLGFWNGTNATSLANWQTTSGQDAHSYDVNPNFISPTDLHVDEVDLNNTATPLAAVTDDFDGEPRDPLTPDIGADEFAPITIDDASVIAIASPNVIVPFPSGVQPVHAVLRNSGANPLLTALISWEANGLTQAAYNWSGMLLPGERDTVAIGNHNFTPGFGHDLLAYSQLPNGLTDSNFDNDTTEVLNLYPALQGIYTIGGTFPDFPNFTAAANSLNNGGVLGAVTFNVRNGTYDEAISLDPVKGGSAANTVLFQSQNGDSSLVKMRYTDNFSPEYVVRLNGADYVTFQKMTIQTTGCCINSVFELTNGASNNKVLNCDLASPGNASASVVYSNSGFLDNSNLIENNRIEGGGYGINFYGQSSSLLESGNAFLHNTLLNQQYYGILAYYQNAPRAERNVITTNSAYNSFDGIHLGYCDNNTRVLRNKISIPNGTGLRLYSCDGVNASRVLVANNFISVGGSVTAYGIYTDYGAFQNIYYNNVSLTNASASSRALQQYYGSNKNFLNNVFANSGGGYAAYVQGASGVASSNFNDLYASGAILGSWEGVNAANLLAWRSASGKDLNSVSANPLFYSASDLHVLQVALDGDATALSAVPADFDGQARHATQPDIGADEFDYLTDDLGITQLVTPTEACNIGNMATVRVLIQNFGGLPQTGFNVAYRLNGAAQVSENVGALSVPPGGTAEYAFATKANMSFFLLHELELYTLLGGDLNHPNDTLEATVQNHQTPAVVGNMLPANGTVNVDLPISFSWLPAAGATRYDLFVWRTTDPVPTVPVAQDITQITYAYNNPGFIYGATYNWKLVAKNSFCSTPGPVQSFTLRELPDLVASNVQPPLSPFSGQPIEVSWQVQNPGLGSTGMATWYDYIYLSADNAFHPDIDTYLGGFANFTALNGSGSYSNMQNVTLPNGIQGQHYVFVITDYGENVIEGNDNNNVSPAASMVVNLTPPPDLIVQSFITPTNAFSGTNVNVSWTIKNQGTGNVPPGNYFYDYVYFSNEPDFNPATATFMGSYWSDPIAAGAMQTRTQSISIPNGIFGNHYVHVLTDRFNYVFEFAFESNNTGNSNAINIILTPPPDLVVQNVVTPDTTSNNQEITMSWRVKNQGATAAAGGFHNRVWMSANAVFSQPASTLLGEWHHGSPINAGVFTQFSENVVIPSNVTGKRYLFVETDVFNNIFEYVNEGNNVSAKDSTFVKNVDLVVSAVSVPDPVESGSEVTVNWTVQNQGLGGLVSASRTDRVYISASAVFSGGTATEIGELTYSNALAPGESLLRQKTVTIPNGLSGTRYLHVLTDQGNAIFENANEGNNANSDQTTVMLAPWADLRVDAPLTGLPASTVAGTMQTLTFTVHNYGTAAVQGVSGGWKDWIYISANPVWNINNAVLLETLDVLQPLAPGGTYSLTKDFILPMLGGGATTGICYIYVFTDATNKIYEHTDEGNNTRRSDPISVTAPPPVDFDVLNSTNFPDTLNSGQTVNLQWSVKNFGNTTALWNYALWYDGVYLSTDSIYNEYSDLFVKDFTKQGPLGTNETYSKNENFEIPNGISGNYFAFLTADHTELTNDGNEANNVQRIRPASFPAGVAKPIYIRLSPSPDLTVTTLLAPSSGISGQPVQIIWTVENEGVGTASGSWTDKIYLSTDFDVTGDDPIIASKSQTRTLATGQSYTDTMEAFIPITSTGNFVLIFKTDANNALFEFNGEGNNEFFTYLTASLPLPSDLSVSNISFSSMAMVGEPFSVSYRLNNQGTNPATGEMRDLIYFSVDSVFSPSDVPFLGPFERNINLAPAGNLTESFSNVTPGVPLGDYFIIVQTDALNNIYENSDLNNVSISTGKVTVSVQQLPLGVLTPDSLTNEVPLYYRIEIPAGLLNETMLVTLDGQTPASINELYVSFGTIPTRSVHQFSFSNPFAADQAITVPEVQVGQYYLLAYGSTTHAPADGKQDIDLKAEIIPFQIMDVDAEQGGNTGNVTLRIDGAKFTPDMEVRLQDATLGSVTAHTLTFINSTRVFATFNLSGMALGLYDVAAEKSPAVVTLPNGFEIIAGGAGTTTGAGGGSGGFFCNIVNVGTDQNLQQNIAHPASIRVNRVAPITIQFGNDGDVDIPCPSRWLLSLRGAPVGFTVAELSEGKEELFLSFMEVGGPPGILRPGSSSSITVYAFSSHAMRFVLRE